MQTGSFSLQAAAPRAPVARRLSFFSPPWRGIRATTDQPSYLSICGIGDEGDSSKFPSPPSRPVLAPARLTKYYNDGRPNALVLPVVSGPEPRVCFRENDARLCTISRSYVCVSPPPKRIRGKRARRWINTKTSVTHDQPRPSSVSSSASACAHRRALLRDGIGVALVLQDVHLDQYHWKLSKQIIDRAKKNPEAAHPDRPTNRTNRTRRYITHTGVAREENEDEKEKKYRAAPRGEKERDKKRIKK